MSYLHTLSTHKIYTDRIYLAGHEIFPDIVDQLENVQSSVTDGLEDKVDQSVFDANVLSLMNELQTKQTKGAIVSITDTTDSVSKTTGSLVTAGGIGIAKNVTVGGGKVSIIGTGGGRCNFDS